MKWSVGRRCTRLLSWVVAAVSLSSAARAMTREDVQVAGWLYLTVQYGITSKNVWPEAPCFLGSGFGSADNTGLGEHLAIGTYEGEVYGFGLYTPWYALASALASGAAAGDYDVLYDRSAADASCLLAHAVGIDCSGLVFRAWGYTSRPGGTYTLTEAKYSNEILLESDVKLGDAVVWSGHHARLVFVPPAGQTPWDPYVTWEAVGDDNPDHNRCVQLTRDWIDDVVTGPYVPCVSVKLKDDPAADVFAFCAGRRSDQIIVAWETLLERDTQGFVVERATSRDGPFEAVSDVLPRRGGDASGARYQFADAGYPGGEVYYQLREIETSGRELLHGVTGPVSLAGGDGR